MFNKMANIVLNLHIPKTKWDGAEDPTHNRSQPQYVISTEVDRILLGDKCPRGLVWSTSRDTCQVGKFFRTRLQIGKHHLISQREN